MPNNWNKLADERKKASEEGRLKELKDKDEKIKKLESEVTKLKTDLEKIQVIQSGKPDKAAPPAGEAEKPAK